MTGDGDISKLIGQLKKANYDQDRSKAMNSLADSGEPAVEPLIECLKVRGIADYAGIALAKIGDVRGFKAVLQMGSTTRLATFHPTTFRTMQVLAGLDPFDYVAELTPDSVLDLPSAVLPTAVMIWPYGKRNPRVVQTVKDIDKAIANEVVEPLIEVLSKGVMGNLRAMAALALGGVSDDPRVIEALRLALDDDGYVTIGDSQMAIPILGVPQNGYIVSEVAGLSLVRLGDRDSARRIARQAIENWRYQTDLGSKLHISRYMFERGWDEVVTELGLMHQHKDRYTRERAISRLATIADPQVVQPLAGFLNDRQTSVSKKAIEALGEIGDSSALEVLTQAAQDKKRAVRNAARNAMQRIKARIEWIGKD
jgi:hypothetical protein